VGGHQKEENDMKMYKLFHQAFFFVLNQTL